MSPARSVGDIYLLLLERLGSGAFPLGSRLPSCRALARELESNPSTVSRALRRLAADGLVRTEERRGSFVTATRATGIETEAQIRTDMARIVSRGLAAGYDRPMIARMFQDELTETPHSPRVAFVECNAFDLDRMSRMVENATGVTVQRILLAELGDDWPEQFDVVAAPLFHLADIAARSPGLDRVVELNFVPTADALHRIARLDPGRRVVVVLPMKRGIERVSSLVRQYFAGRIDTYVAGAGSLPRLDSDDVLVTTRALGLSDVQRARLPEVILVDWTLDQHSARTFRLRIEQTPAE